MSGHSKWAQIKYKKGITDKRKGKEFGKLAGTIAIAARSGTDPDSNFSLRLVVERARAANMPKDKIEQAIMRGSGKLPGVKFEDITYEGFGPGGTAFIADAATDNKNRTTSEIRNLFAKFGGHMSGAGSVDYLFKTIGIIRVKLPSNKDDLELELIDLGASDFEEQEQELIIYCQPTKMHKIRAYLLGKHLEILHQEISKEAKDQIKINDLDQAEKVLDLAEALEDHEQVVAVASNFDILDEVLAQVQKGK